MFKNQSHKELKQKIKQLEDDVTLHKLEVQALSLSNEKYKDLFENANDAIFIVDANLQYTEVNKKAVELFGYSKEEFLGMKITDVIPSEQIQTSTEEFIKLRKEGIYEKFVGKQRTKDGRWLDIEVNSSAIIHNGKYIGSRDIIRDITERKRAEQELHKYRVHLEDLVDERTAEILRYAHQLEREITERKLAEKEQKKLESQLMQKQRIEAIGALAGGIAHDFNNILNAILSYTELTMASTQPDNRNYSHLEKVLQSVKKAEALVSQILTFSSRHTEKNRVSMHLQPLIKEEMKLLRGTLPDNISLRIDINPNCPPVCADFIQLHQVILNICTNAVHAMEGDGGTLSVSLQEVEVDPDYAKKHPDLSPQRYAQLVFRDTGHGMDKNTLQRIFEPYFTTKKFGTGTGLGLATVHGIIRGHDGACIVESTLGGGSSFIIYLPLANQFPREVEKSYTKRKPPTGSGTVLFIDDEKMIIEAAKITLESFGYNVDIFSNGGEALTAFQKESDKYDIVITDQKMPGINGLELAQKILDIRPDIPIVLATGYSETVDEKIAKHLGITETVMKPISMTDLASIIDGLINQTQVKENKL